MLALPWALTPDLSLHIENLAMGLQIWLPQITLLPNSTFGGINSSTGSTNPIRSRFVVLILATGLFIIDG